jgi:uncharacterized RDD family membrane protein YckC
MLPENPTFIIRGEDGEEYGPVGLGELRGWVAENRAGIGTEVKRDDPGATWQPWQNFPELVALLAEVNATGTETEVGGLALAPIWRRALALVLDLILSYILLLPVMTALAFAFLPDWLHQTYVAASAAVDNQTPYTPPEMSVGAQRFIQITYYFSLILYFWGYFARHGRTPAQALFRLRVVNEAGEAPSSAQAMARAFGIAFSLLFCFLPMFLVFFNPQRRTLHDLLAGTYVVEA